MSYTMVPLMIIVSIVSILSLFITVVLIREKNQLHYSFLMLLCSILLWNVGALHQTLNLQTKEYIEFFIILNYVGAQLCGPSMLICALVFSKTKIRYTYKYLFLSVIPLITIISIVTNKRYGLFYKEFNYIDTEAAFGPAFTLHIAYTYITLAIALYIFLKYIIKNSGLFSKQAMLIIIGALIPLVIDILTTFHIIKGGSYTTVATVSLFAILLGAAIFKYDLLSTTPIALQTIVDHISDGLVVVDERGRIIDFNRQVLKMFKGIYDIERYELVVELFNSLSINEIIVERISQINKMEESINIDKKVKKECFTKYFNIEITPMFNKKLYIGCVVLFKDITNYMESIHMIKKYQNILERDKRELIEKNAVTEKIARTDALTNMYNHRAFYEYLEEILSQSSEDFMMELALLDIDNFKGINDKFGHSRGDTILKRVSYRIKTLITSDDIAARYGGEEFAIIFTNKNAGKAFSILENIRKKIEEEVHPEIDRQVTVSIGLYKYLQNDTKEKVFIRADKALYQAKQMGKNKTVTYEHNYL